MVNAFQRRLLGISTTTLIFLLCFLMYIFDSFEPDPYGYVSHSVVEKTHVIQRNDEGNSRCRNVCILHRKKRRKKFHGDVTKRDSLLQMMKAARGKMLEKMRKDYGEDYFSKIFENSNSLVKETRYRGVRPASKDGPSKIRLRPFASGRGHRKRQGCSRM